MKDWKSIYLKKHCPNPFLNKPLLRILLVLVFLNGCGASQPHVAENPASQRFLDLTGKLLHNQKSSPKQALFLNANQDVLPDLIILKKAKPRKPQVEIFINQDKKGFQHKSPGRWLEELETPILSLTTADLNRDGGDDLILIMKKLVRICLMMTLNC